MAGAWKIRRELLRVWHQAYDIASIPADRFRQKKHDVDFPKRVHLLDGSQGVDRKVALFLIYQPGRVANSVLVTCGDLVARGFAILLVSNTPIDAADLERLKPLCWRIAIRPNFGYDFGGYRDGLRVIHEAGLDPDRLVILNDSIWYPTNPDCALLDRLETQGEAFTGPVFIGNAERSPANRHFQSFFFLIRREALQSAAFLAYWRNGRVSSRKRVVLKQGEKGFSQAMFSGGFGGNPLPTRETLHKELSKQSNAFLYKTLCYASYADQSLLDEATALLRDDPEMPGWRGRALTHMWRAVSRHSPIGVFVYASMLLLDLGFLKKRSFSDVFDGMRWQYVRAVRNGDLPAPHPDVMEEILMSKMDGRLTTDPDAGLRA